MRENKEHIRLLSQPLHSDVDHLDILHDMYFKYSDRGFELTSLMNYFLNGLDDIPIKKQELLWSKKEFQKRRKLFEDSYFELLEILQKEYDSFQYNFKIIESRKLSPDKFREYPLWSEYYDFEEIEDIQGWGFKKDDVIKELKKKEIDGHHPLYTAPICEFPIIRLRYFTKTKFKTKEGAVLEGAIMNDGSSVIYIFIGDEYLTINNHPLLRELNNKSLQKISNFYRLPMISLNQLEFETEIPVDKDKRIKGIFMTNKSHI